MTHEHLGREAKNLWGQRPWAAKKAYIDSQAPEVFVAGLSYLIRRIQADPKMKADPEALAQLRATQSALQAVPPLMVKSMWEMVEMAAEPDIDPLAKLEALDNLTSSGNPPQLQELNRGLHHLRQRNINALHIVMGATQK